MSIVVQNGQQFRITGRLLRIVSPRDEWLDDIGDPNIVVRSIKEKHIHADILTFIQNLPDISPRFDFHMEWDNIAAIPISTYEEWFRNQIHRNTRNKIRMAYKKGVDVKISSFNKALIEGLVNIFNETPIRRGKQYPYFGKNEEEVKKEWSPEHERVIFIVAYFNSEIIGFIKLLYCFHCARTSGTIANLAHRDKSPMNALLAKAVEICAEKKIPYLIYGKYIYGRKGEDSLTKFKRYNGFQRIDVPRYYIPLSIFGRIALKLGLHHDISSVLPSGVLRVLLRIRSLCCRKIIKANQ